jgi:hypothetical protein
VLLWSGAEELLQAQYKQQMQADLIFSGIALPPSLTDPSLYEGGIPARISSLADAQEYSAAFDQVPVAGAFSHEIAPQIWVGAQAAAGILAKHEDTPAERDAILKQLRERNTAVIICCCDEGPSARRFEGDGIRYADARLSDGSPQSIAACATAFFSLLERAYPLAAAALAGGDSVLVHCNSGMHRSASVALGLIMILQSEQGAEGLARVFASAVKKRPVIRPTFWPLLESKEFAEFAARLRALA